MTENTLRSRLARPPIVVAPGVYDPLTALIAERAGFNALYVSGAAIAYTRLGRPDIGLVSMNEVVETVALIRDRVGAHLDRRCRHRLRQCAQCRSAPSACSSAPAPMRSRSRIRIFPSVAAIWTTRALIPAAEMVGKIKAALDARTFTRNADHRAHRCNCRRRLRSRRRARASSTARPVRIYCLSRRRKRAPSLQRIRSARGQCRWWPTWSRAARRRSARGGGSGSDRLLAGHFPGRDRARVGARPRSEFYASLAAHGTTEPFLDRMYRFRCAQ